MKKQCITAGLYTAITAILLGVLYPLGITAIARVLFPAKAAGQLITQHGVIIGSRIIGQPFTGPAYFHSRPSAAGAGYDASASGGSNLGPTSKALVDRVQATLLREKGASPIPADLVTASASGLDPDITPAAAVYQVARVAAARKLTNEALTALIDQHLEPRQFGLLGEPRVNVLQLNLSLDALSSRKQ